MHEDPFISDDIPSTETQPEPAVHPGILLQQKYMSPHSLTANALANRLLVPTNRITEILRGRRGITADTDLRLSRFFGTTAGYWLAQQNRYDMARALEKEASLPTRRITAIAPVTALPASG